MRFVGKTVSDRQTDIWTGRQTDGRTDKVSYRGATLLKIMQYNNPELKHLL